MPLLNPSTASPSPEVIDKPIILHLGDEIEYNHQLHDRLRSQFHIIHPAPADLKRPAFLSHLRNQTWGNFQAIMRPFWNTGGEMGHWDKELIDLLPKGLKVYASAGAGYDWVDADILAEHGTFRSPSLSLSFGRFGEVPNRSKRSQEVDVGR